MVNLTRTTHKFVKVNKVQAKSDIVEVENYKSLTNPSATESFWESRGLFKTYPD
jgi:hypothetical protein